MNDGPEGNAAPFGMGAVAASSSSSITGGGFGRGPPIFSGGARSSRGDGVVDAEVRRSQRSWKPSNSCLESIAHVSRELTLAETEMDQSDATPVGDGQGGGAVGVMPSFQDSGVLPQLWDLASKAGESATGGMGRPSQVEGDLAFWFWEPVHTDFCPKKHAEAMALPLAEKVREAELNEYNSHLQSGTFGPPLAPCAFAPGSALKAVWVYSR